MVDQGPKGKEGPFTSKGNRGIVSHQFKVQWDRSGGITKKKSHSRS